MANLLPLIPFLPLISFLYIAFFGKGLSKSLVGWIASTSVLISFCFSVVVFMTCLHGETHFFTVFEWIRASNLHVNLGFMADPLSAIYLLFITGVGFLIHVYSIGYMHSDEGFSRFMAYLNLFVFFMLILVLGDSYLTMFVGWEGVGLCSFMLIGFWYKDMKNNDAAKKAFVMNRVGDLGFILGMFLLFYQAGTLNFNELYGSSREALHMGNSTTTWVAVLFFIGAMGKSAQFPLHTWLPDAMAGPTPVSALIHAATMVTAGIYMVARSSPLFDASETARQVVLLAGLITALLGATIALTQNDIKKVLAYSTVSQLGFMFVALGVGAYSIAVFHVITHAFFKALLFLGSGSVIHAMGGEQDIRRMGGLKSHLKTTHLTFLIGTIAISGIPPLAGFFSKDQIIAATLGEHSVVFALLLIASALTAFYMFRLYFLTFRGSFRGTHDQEHHLHESPAVMTMPLVVLAVLSVVGGFIGFPHELGHLLNINHWLDHFLSPVLVMNEIDMSLSTEIILMLVATVIAVVAAWYAWLIYQQRKTRALEDREIDHLVHLTVYNKYWMDELYETTIRKPLDRLSAILGRWVEPRVVDGAVNATGSWTKALGAQLRQVHSGSLFVYIAAMVLALIVLLWWKV